MDTIVDDNASLIARVFALVGGFDPEDVSVEFREDETIRVYVAGSGLWVMVCGSDDDGFWFHPAEAFDADDCYFIRPEWNEPPIEFAFPEGWQS